MATQDDPIQNSRQEVDSARTIRPSKNQDRRPAPPAPAAAPRPTASHSIHPTWEHTFATQPDGPIDPAVWNIETDPAIPGWNKEKQLYTNQPKNVRIENGALVIQAHKEPFQVGGITSQYTSARITTKGKFDFMYGKMVVRAKLPAGNGTWPAIWMLSTDQPYTKNATDAQWAADPHLYAKDGEIDIMEAVGYETGWVFAATHTYNSHRSGAQQTNGTKVGNIYTEFHDYGVEWQPDSLLFTVDGKPYYKVARPSDNPDDWPFQNQRMHLILNLAVGGTWADTKGIDDSKAPWRFEIQSIRYYR